ncbi:exodeoxyribonuclease VII large subunit [Mannheimia granulomatis]|uniref:Exodeoxyribonuclease 7 large subunit n=1 Tax=Mannheimia granulomatis TaxID=85402 RepID=A0A011LX23_9PAST|nr:exodeoxyribonuclease VII large subunit [Mannheimia granulomatis]EXI61773.1 exodeoxyribonuclease VII large subunit [Mannheimia granulomatis]RGE48457.1 exodeoxyribonuclease VII large subunit [Mannheimia granulomatis]
MSNILTVTQLNYSVRHLLEMELSQIWLTGEISNFSQPVSGHWYLTLKDDKAQVRCAMFKMKNAKVHFRPQNGMQVLVRASVTLYEPRGDYQIIIESMQPAGEGLLQQQFEQLKAKLAAQGWFAQEHKKTIPSFAKRVGIITSSSGAALQDILNILQRRDPSLSVVIYPTLVQGKEAAQDIVNAIELANRRNECDVLIIGRGGGSLEDLWCFNEEVVAQAIYRSQIPTISAVGHETDITIADFVADLRAPTPSAAAELVSRDQRELFRQLQHQFDKVNLAFDRVWSRKVGHFQQLILRLNAQHPTRQLQSQQQKFTHIKFRLEYAINSLLAAKKQYSKELGLRLASQHPKEQIERQKQTLSQAMKNLQWQMEQLLLKKQQQWTYCVKRFEKNPFPYQLKEKQALFTTFSQRLDYAIEKKMLTDSQRFQSLCTKLDGLSPLKILTRGYSITQTEDGKMLTSTTDLKRGDKITTQLKTGKIISQVVDFL